MRRLLAGKSINPLCFHLTFAADSAAFLLPKPTLSKTQIAFAYVETSGLSIAPVGTAIAVTGRACSALPLFAGRLDDCLQPAITMELMTSTWSRPPWQNPALTYHPSAMWRWLDARWQVQFLFHSHRPQLLRPDQLFTMPAEGGVPTVLLFDGRGRRVLSDGSHRAYSPLAMERIGSIIGRANHAIWIADLADSSVVKVGWRLERSQPIGLAKGLLPLGGTRMARHSLEYDTKSQEVRS